MKYHYTGGLKLAPILEDELIRPTELYLARGERGVAWFTTRLTFEPTAIPAFETGNTRNALTVPELAEIGDGLYRFGVRDDHPQLHPWLKICRLACTPKKIRVALESVARQKGSDPYMYWGSLTPISIYECALEESLDGASWHCAISKTQAAGAGR
jgi:hypothetical protein